MRKPEWAPVTEHGQPRTGKTKNSVSLALEIHTPTSSSPEPDGNMEHGHGRTNSAWIWGWKQNVSFGYLGALERSSRGREVDLVHPQVPLVKARSMHGRAQSPQSDEVV